MLTLEEQIAGLEKLTTNSSQESTARDAVRATLLQLVTIRDLAADEDPDPDNIASLVMSVLGVQPPAQPA